MRKKDLLSDAPRVLLEQAEQFLKQSKTGEDLNSLLSQLQERGLEAILKEN